MKTGFPPYGGMPPGEEFMASIEIHGCLSVKEKFTCLTTFSSFVWTGGMNMPPGGMPGVPPFMAPPFMQQPPQALPRPAAPPPLPSPDDPSNWSEHTSPDGRKYYYNKVR